MDCVHKLVTLLVFSADECICWASSLCQVCHTVIEMLQVRASAAARILKLVSEGSPHPLIASPDLHRLFRFI